MLSVQDWPKASDAQEYVGMFTQASASPLLFFAAAINVRLRMAWRLVYKKVTFVTATGDNSARDSDAKRLPALIAHYVKPPAT